MLPYKQTCIYLLYVVVVVGYCTELGVRSYYVLILNERFNIPLVFDHAWCLNDSRCIYKQFYGTLSQVSVPIIHLIGNSELYNLHIILLLIIILYEFIYKFCTDPMIIRRHYIIISSFVITHVSIVIVIIGTW